VILSFDTITKVVFYFEMKHNVWEILGIVGFGLCVRAGIVRVPHPHVSVRSKIVFSTNAQ